MKYFLVFLVFCFSLQSTAAVLNGNEGAEGGDDIGLEFQLLARKTLRDIQRNYPEIARQFSADEYLFYVDRVKTLVVNDSLELLLKGARQNSVAVNVASEKIIYVNRNRWDKIFDQRVKAGIVLHEYLSLMGLESTGMYSVSALYMALVGMPKTSDFPAVMFYDQYNNKCNSQTTGSYKVIVSAQGIVEATILVGSGLPKAQLRRFAKLSGVKPEGIVGFTFRQQTGVFNSNTCVLLNPGRHELVCFNYTKQQSITFLYQDKSHAMAMIAARDFSVSLVSERLTVNLSLSNSLESLDMLMSFSSEECLSMLGI